MSGASTEAAFEQLVEEYEEEELVVDQDQKGKHTVVRHLFRNSNET